MSKIFFNKLIAGVLLMGATVSCTGNFEDLNTNPDDTNSAPPSMFATQVILGMTKFSGRDAMAYMEGQMDVKLIGSRYNTASQYNEVRRGWMGFTALPTIDNMLKYAESSNNAQIESYRALAKYARASMFWASTTIFGDIPYSEAGQALTGNITPKYDTQKNVALGILKELEEAEALFAKGINFDGDPTPLGGNAEKWRKVVNATRLNVLMCLSKKESDTDLNIKKRFQDIVSAGNLLDEATYLGLVYNATQMHPLYGAENLYYTYMVQSALVVDYLKQTGDYRLFYFADPAPARIAEGLGEGDMEAYVGCDVSMDNAQLMKEIDEKKYSPINLRYYKEKDSEPRRVYSYAMQELTIAEAIVRGWMSGDAKVRYENAVKAALKSYMNTAASYAHGKPITQAYIDGYFSNPAAAFAATSSEQLKQIIIQKYLLGYMQPQNSTLEYRRTKLPDFPINPDTNRNPGRGGGFPMRNQYPDSEYTYNLTNLTEALNRQWNGDDDQNNLMWILQ